MLEVDEIIIDDLKYNLNILLTPNRDEGGCYMDLESDLIDAFKKVLCYYLPQNSETDRYMGQLALQEMTSIAVINGEYDN